jgi:uncharacterized protein (TIGR02466 family)
MEPILISPHLVYKVNCPVDLTPIAERSSKLLDTIIDSGEVEQDGGITSTGHLDAPHLWDETRLLNGWLRGQAEKVLTAWNLNYNTFGITKSWVNSHFEGAWTDTHDHGDSHLVCSVYIQQPENGGNLEFENKERTLFAGYPRFAQNQSKLHNYFTEVEVKQGDVVFFPGWLSHKSQPNKSLQRRIVMGMNWHCALERPQQLDNNHITRQDG